MSIREGRAGVAPGEHGQVPDVPAVGGEQGSVEAAELDQ
ncbi:MAG: hypothetical protein JWQ99_3861 [Blastococcus sp.]|jgi:hypothetical protein|nr:hypothetical protein [Blastococcus sp.]